MPMWLSKMWPAAKADDFKTYSWLTYAPSRGGRAGRKERGMKIRSQVIKADRAIRQIAKELGANPVYVWDVAGEEFNIIKGIGCVMDQEQIDAVTEIVRRGLAGG